VFDTTAFHEMDPARTLEQLHQALLEVLQQQEKISEDLLRQTFENWEDYQNHTLHPRPVPSDGLPAKEGQAHPLSSG
jgi:hypothetical protein